MIRLLICFLIANTAAPPALLHPVHVSVSEVKILPSAISWQVRIYSDDLMAGLYGKAVITSRLDDPRGVERDILKYLSRHILVVGDGKPIRWALSTLEHDPESIFVTLTAKLEQPVLSAWKISNTLLTEVYADQKNVVHIDKAGQAHHFLFEKGSGEIFLSR